MTETPRTNLFGPALNRLRMAYGLSGNQLALIVNSNQSHLNKIERGDRYPTPDIIEKLATTFSPDEMAELRQAAAADLLAKKGLTSSDISDAPTEEITPEKAANWVKVHFRKKDLPPERQEQFIKDMLELLRAADAMRDEL